MYRWFYKIKDKWVVLENKICLYVNKCLLSIKSDLTLVISNGLIFENDISSKILQALKWVPLLIGKSAVGF